MDNPDLTNKDLAYDLRQVYVEIVGYHLKNIYDAQINKDYPRWFNGLEDLYTVAVHNFKSSDLKKITSYKYLRKQFLQIANKYSQAYNGNSQNANEIGEVEESLRKIQRWLYKRMKTSNMLGSKWEDDGL